MDETNINMEQPNSKQVEITESKNIILDNKNNEENATPEFEKGSIGKFKDAESLLNAYNNLQAEFTRKCQKLSELETRESENKTVNTSAISEDEKNNLLKEYLEVLRKSGAPQVISDTMGSGIPLKTPPSPKNLDEAKSVVKNLFK